MKTLVSVQQIPVGSRSSLARAGGTLAVLCALALCTGCSSQEESVRRAQAEVGKAMAEGDLEAARAALARLRKNEPATPEAVQQVANLMIRAGEAPQALWLLQDGLQRFPERHDLRLLFARVALMLGEASRALAELEPIERDSLFHPDALVLRARATLELGQLDAALTILAEADDLYPELPAARLVHYQVLFQERRFEEALKLVEEAKAHAASDAELRALRIMEARARGIQGEREEAVAILLQLAEEDMDSFGAWPMLVQALTALDRREEAVALVESAIEEDLERGQLYPLLADIYVEDGERAKAEEVLRRFVEISQSPSAYMSLARFHRSAGDLEQVLSLVEEALGQFPRQPMLLAARVEVLLDLERLDDARATLQEMQSEERVGERPEIQYLQARVKLAGGDAQGAADLLRELAGDLDRAETHFYLGLSLEELGDLEGAERAYALAQERSSGLAEPVLALLRVAAKQEDAVGQRDAARRLLRFPEHRAAAFGVLVESLLTLQSFAPAERAARRFREEAPEALDAHILLARALWQQGHADDAEQVLADAEEQLGPSPGITAERAAALAAADRTGDGVAALEEALAERPDDPELIHMLAGLYFEQRDFGRGSALVDRALEQNPDDLGPLRLRVIYAAVNGPLEIARADAERYLEKHPRDHEIHFRLGSVYARLGLTDEAVKAYRRSAELAEGAFAPRNNLALLYQESGDLDQALELAHEAYELQETDPDVLDTLGWIYFEKGLLERSISLLEEAHEGAPGRIGTLHLALAYREAGRTDEAQELLATLVDRADLAANLRSQAEAALRQLR